MQYLFVRNSFVSSLFCVAGMLESFVCVCGGGGTHLSRLFSHGSSHGMAEGMRKRHGMRRHCFVVLFSPSPADLLQGVRYSGGGGNSYQRYLLAFSSSATSHDGDLLLLLFSSSSSSLELSARWPFSLLFTTLLFADQNRFVPGRPRYADGPGD